MMNTVAAVASAMYSPRWVCAPSALNASSGPYAEEERPSAPRPTHAMNAASAMCCRLFWLNGSRGAPITHSRICSYLITSGTSAVASRMRALAATRDDARRWFGLRRGCCVRAATQHDKTLLWRFLLCKAPREDLHFLHRLLVAFRCSGGNAVAVGIQRLLAASGSRKCSGQRF